MGILLFGLILLPVITGPLLFLLVGKAAGIRRFVAPVVTALALACSLGLLFFGEQDVPLPITWLPGSGDWSLHVGGIGLYALIVTVGCALVARILAMVFEPAIPLELDAIFLVALGGAALAFLSDHFLARYLALEIVALCIAAGCLVQLRREIGPQAAGYVYLLLRVGDAGLLSAILLLLAAGDTLRVGEALQVGMQLPNRSLVWVLIGFSVAVWVKVGAWPFHSWQRVGLAFSSPVGVWLHGILMPQLGLYLLYRITPLIAAGGDVMRALILALGLGSAAVIAELWMRGDDAGLSFPVYGSAILGSLALTLTAADIPVGVAAILIAAAPVRLWVGLRQMLAPISPLDREAVIDEPARAVQVVISGAQALRDAVEHRVFDLGPVRATHAVMDGARALHGTVEQGGLEGLLNGTAQTIVALGRGVQSLHTGRLRTGLLWVVLSLVAVVLLTRAR